MKKNIFSFIAVCSVAIFACISANVFAQVTPQQSAISDTLPATADTSNVATAAITTQATGTADSAQLLLKKLDSQSISHFNTFSAKAKINSSAIPVPLTANIRIQKDSIIWISLTATVLITTEVARAIVTPDSILVMDKLHKNVIRRSIDFLQTLLKLPFTFYDLQNVILGNPLMTQDSVISASNNSGGKWYISVGNDSLKNLLILQNYGDTALVLERSFLQDSTAAKNLSGDILYDSYQPINDDKYFSQTRNITLSDSADTQQATMQFLNFNFDKPIDFPFNIPDNYSEK